MLYSLITFGVVLDQEAAVASLDPPDHMVSPPHHSPPHLVPPRRSPHTSPQVRLRLVCVLLDTCGQYFSSGASKKKLDYFILYFQVTSQLLKYFISGTRPRYKPFHARSVTTCSSGPATHQRKAFLLEWQTWSPRPSVTSGKAIYFVRTK